MAKTLRLPVTDALPQTTMTFGVCATCDPRIDPESRQRARNIVVRRLPSAVPREDLR